MIGRCVEVLSAVGVSFAKEDEDGSDMAATRSRAMRRKWRDLIIASLLRI
jgi:hypothetical protein